MPIPDILASLLDSYRPPGLQNILALIEIMLSLSPPTSQVERVFSTRNLIINANNLSDLMWDQPPYPRYL